MSYCRWSSDNGYCDVYVYEDVNGGWTAHIAGRRRPPGRPPGMIEFMGMYCMAGGGTTPELTAEAQEAIRLLVQAQKAWDEANPHIPIAHDLAGESFNFATPLECADALRMWKVSGLMVPDYAIQELIEEGEEASG